MATKKNIAAVDQRRKEMSGLVGRRVQLARGRNRYEWKGGDHVLGMQGEVIKIDPLDSSALVRWDQYQVIFADDKEIELRPPPNPEWVSVSIIRTE